MRFANRRSCQYAEVSYRPRQSNHTHNNQTTTRVQKPPPPSTWRGRAVFSTETKLPDKCGLTRIACAGRTRCNWHRSTPISSRRPTAHFSPGPRPATTPNFLDAFNVFSESVALCIVCDSFSDVNRMWKINRS
jgi:hypothetical protein